MMPEVEEFPGPSRCQMKEEDASPFSFRAKRDRLSVR